jgi:hypothetical protein
MNTFDLVSDISTLTTLPDKTLRRLCDKSVECICHNVLETLQNEELETSIDISIGTIKIIVDNNEIHYRFIPSNKLESMLVETINSGVDPLVKHIEESLTNRILTAYKDLI